MKQIRRSAKSVVGERMNKDRRDVSKAGSLSSSTFSLSTASSALFCCALPALAQPRPFLFPPPKHRIAFTIKPPPSNNRHHRLRSLSVRRALR